MFNVGDNCLTIGKIMAQNVIFLDHDLENSRLSVKVNNFLSASHHLSVRTHVKFNDHIVRYFQYCGATIDQMVFKRKKKNNEKRFGIY